MGFKIFLPVLIMKGHNIYFNPVALRKAKIVYNFGLSECNRVNGEGTKVISILS